MGTGKSNKIYVFNPSPNGLDEDAKKVFLDIIELIASGGDKETVKRISDKYQLKKDAKNENKTQIMNVKRQKNFANGIVYCLELSDGKLIETTDTFLPYYTKDAIGRKQNKLNNYHLGDRSERWMIGVSVMSGCPVRCKFCATGQIKGFRNLSADEIVQQVEFAIDKAGFDPKQSKEFKINYTRMGEPFLNIENVKEAIGRISQLYPNTHHYVSTIGVNGSDFSFVKENISLQISLHSFIEEKRNWLIPYPAKMSIEELGQIRTGSNLKTTVNLTLVDESDFDATLLKKYFDKDYFFIKLSPINKNEVSEKNKLGDGIIEGVNLV